MEVSFFGIGRSVSHPNLNGRAEYLNATMFENNHANGSWKEWAAHVTGVVTPGYAIITKTHYFPLFAYSQQEQCSFPTMAGFIFHKNNNTY